MMTMMMSTYEKKKKTILREKNVRNGTLTKRCVYVFGLEFIIGHFEDR